MLKASERITLAAELTDSRTFEYSCNAIRPTCEESYSEEWPNILRESNELRAEYSYLFAPFEVYSTSWLRDVIDDDREFPWKEFRVLALLFFSAQLESEGR